MALSTMCALSCMLLLHLGSCVLLTQDIEFNEQHERGFTTLSYGQILRKCLHFYIEYILHEKSLQLILKCVRVCVPEKIAWNIYWWWHDFELIMCGELGRSFFAQIIDCHLLHRGCTPRKYWHPFLFEWFVM